MTENENKKDTLKLADAEKSDGNVDKISPGSGAEFIEREKQAREKMRGISSRKNVVGRDIPVSVDVIISILIIVLIAAAIVGAVFLFRYYSVSYVEKQIEYVVKIENEESMQYLNVGDSLYQSYDDSGNALFMGKITEKDSNNKTVKIVLDVKYRSDHGYTNGDCRVAVGSKLNFFNDRSIYNVSVVELQEIKGE